MAFSDCAARSFTFASVQNNAPPSSGVYGLSNGREWVFIGESDNIRAHLLGHLSEKGTPLSLRHPTGFVFEVCGPTDRLTRHDTLVREFEPFCNRRH